MVQNKPSIAPRRSFTIGKTVLRDWQLYLLLLLPIAFVIIFKYAAYPGLQIAFMNYKPARGYAGSDWVGWETFAKVFKDADFYRALKNSLLFNFLDLGVGFPVPILLALMLNELRFKTFKRVSQTILYLPHFLSWVIIASVAYTLFRPETGLVNVVLMRMGWIDTGIPFLTESTHWSVTYLLLAVWQNMGWGTIIYLAAITGISPELYEAATVDGAGRFGKIWHVTLPGIRATMVTLLILNLGRVMGSNFERLYAFGNVQVKSVQYQLAIYIYEKGLSGNNFSRATAVGLFQSMVGLLLVLSADWVAKRLGQDGLI
ncbi:MAG: ABC transporter permease subunit [Oscillospiraceae bacterium]|jgi:putative aldouronate transport system permease protein|nr:ABC transporter permease subunit [Oscillospiraceae bacterium]